MSFFPSYKMWNSLNFEATPMALVSCDGGPFLGALAYNTDDVLTPESMFGCYQTGERRNAPIKPSWGFTLGDVPGLI